MHKFIYNTKNIKRNHGISLIEILIALVIVGIFSMLARPSFSEYLQKNKIRALSVSFNVATQIAQSEAIKRGVQVSIQPIKSSGNSWEEGWNIFEDHNKNGKQDGEEELIQTSTLLSEHNLTLTSENSVFASWIGFSPSGATKGDNGIMGGFRICRSDMNKEKSRTVIVQASGNIIVDKGAISCP